MVLPRLRPGTGAILLAVALLALQAILGVPSARAQDDDAFTVRDVEVDVTAESAAAARDSAIVEAQRKAFDQLLLNLAAPEDIARLPPIGDDAISDMVLDFEVEQESVSTVRYIGKMAFRFRAEPVRAYLEQGGVGYAASATRPALVVPVLTRDGSSLLWDDGNGWLAAWSNTSVGGTLVAIAVPLGDLSDIAIIDGPRALDGDMAALQALGQRYGAGDVVVAEAAVSVDSASNEAKLALDAKRYTLAGVAGTLEDELSAPGRETALPDLYAQAAQRVSAFLQEQWKQENLVSSTAEQHLDVAASFASLEEWVDLRRRLGDIATIRRADVLELSRGRARLDLVFLGNLGQLTRALAQRDLSLVPLPPPPIVPGAGPSPMPGAAPSAGPSPMPGAAPSAMPGATPAPGTGGAVTVDPGAMPAPPPPPAASAPQWELRRGGQAPASTSSAAPAVSPPAPSPTPAAADQPTPPAE